MSSGTWIETDEALDVISSIRFLRLTLQNVAGDTTGWKWVVLALHSAVQGAFVCHLSGSAQLGALSEKSFKDQLEALQNEKTPKSEPFLAPPMELLKRISSSDHRLETAGSILEIQADQEMSFKMLNEFRKQFTHFAPQGWMIEISGLPSIIAHCLDLVEAILNDGWGLRHIEEQELDSLKANLNHCRALAAPLKPAK